MVGILGVGVAGLLADRPRTSSIAATLASIGVVAVLAFLSDPILIGCLLIGLGGVGLVFAAFERSRAGGADRPRR